MPNLSVPKTYTDATILNESDLDTSFDFFETFFNVSQGGGIDSLNIKSSGVITDSINDLAITTAKLANSSVTNLKMANDAIDTVELVNNAVTRVKQAAVGQQISDSSGSFSVNDPTDTPVTNLSVSISTIGRPVMLMLISDGTSAAGRVRIGNNAAVTTTVDLNFRRDSSIISEQRLSYTSTGSDQITTPSSSFQYFDVVSAGTYTYDVTVTHIGTGVQTIDVQNTKLVAYEL